MSTDRQSPEPSHRWNGPQDVGGSRVFGTVPRHHDDHYVAYTQPWEGRVWGLTVGASIKGLMSVDLQRSAMEGLPPLAHHNTPYWQRWIYAMEVLLARGGVLTPTEIDQRQERLAEDPDAPLPERSDPEGEAIVGHVLAKGAPFFEGIDLDERPAYTVGDRVLTRRIDIEEPGAKHTRLPLYAQEKVGVIERYHAALPLPDATVAGEERVEHVYAVRFDGTDLWRDATAGCDVCVDLWESYLEPVDTAAGSPPTS